MELMNIIRGRLIIQAAYEFDEEMCVFHFKDDIKIGDWTVVKNICIGGPRTSTGGKCSFDNYLEFVILDKCGEPRTMQFYYNCNCPEIKTTKTYEYNVTQRGIIRFLENHPLFDCIDWNDYDASAVISRIKITVNSDNMNNVEKIDKIRSLLK